MPDELLKKLEKKRKKIEKSRIEKVMSQDTIPHAMLKKQRGGRTWKQVAQDFCRNMLKIFSQEGIDHWVYPQRTMRDLVGDPDNKTFRANCLDYGIKIFKDKTIKSYNVRKFNPVERELKKHGQEI